MSICLASLCGIPASGKSTFCQNLLNSTNQLNFSIIWINFDDYLKLNFDSLETLDRKEYKCARESLLKSLCELIADLKESSVQIPQNNLLPSLKNFIFSNDRFLILLDDNFFYKSMRYKVLQISRKFRTGYFEIYFDCDLGTALSRNSKRFPKVPDEIIKKMFEKFEKPKTTFIVNSEENQENYFEKIKQRFLEAIENSETVQETKIVETEINQNQIHQIDLILRKEISRIIQENKEETDDLKTLANSLNERRKQLLIDIRNNLVEFSNDLSDIKNFIN
jgi:O-phosphoseryl-tRNA(Sec) kinase